MTTTISSHPQNFANLKCSPTTLICREKTVILGDVTIGPDCVIHPTTNICAKNGPIVIGANNLIEERASIINNRPQTMVIGDHNVFQVDSHCEALKVGDNNILESKSYVGGNIELTSNCIIGAGCKFSGENFAGKERQVEDVEIEILPQFTVISGKDLVRRVVPNLPISSHVSQMDFLRKILPNYQKLWRPANLPSTPQQHR